MRIDHQKMELFFLPFLVDGAEEHTAGFDAHHGSGRQIRDGDAGLSDQLFRLVIGVNTVQNRPILAGTIIKRKLQEHFRLLHRLAVQHLHGAEIALGEGIKIHLILNSGSITTLEKSIFSSPTGASTGASTGFSAGLFSAFGISSGFIVGTT